jgi:hypothetical protein
MGAGSSIGTDTNSLYAYGVIIAEYERYKRSLTDGTEELLGYDLDPLDDVTLMERMADLYTQALAQKDSTLEDSGLHPVIFAERYKALTEEGKVNYCKAVVEAQVALDKATFKSKPVEADYSKSFSGSAADTKAEKEAAALMKGEEDTKEVEVNPLLDPPKAAYSTFTTNADLAKRYDRALLLSVGQWLKYFSNSGCYLYINTCTKEVASVRPSSYDEDEDKGGGILPEEELNNVGAGGGGAMGAAEAGEKVPEGVVVCSLRDLPGAVDRAVEDKKTPLILDPSEDGKVKTFFDYKYRLADASPLALPFAKSGLKRSDAVESYRKTLVGALKAGTTFALYLGELTQDDVNWKKKLCKKDCFPSETMVEAGRKLFSPPYEPRYRLIFREEDLEEGEIVLKNEENFRTVVISALKPKDYEAKLGESLALGYMQAIYVSG